MLCKTAKLCHCCDSELKKDEIGINKKLLDEKTKKNIFLCMRCLAEYLECSEDDLREKIEDFKHEGCKLFS